MSDEYDHLLELAEAATPGPWAVVRDFVRDGGDNIVAGTSEDADAAFIAACDPATIRELVAAVRRGQEIEVERLADAMYEAGRLGLIYDGITNKDEAAVYAAVYNGAIDFDQKYAAIHREDGA